ncbi:MAG: triosephosphate isomerase [Candidatus Levybacteria bacterium]|nr:triosephosphate isomerase [Candidatus Levybacteria bacterium]
MSLGPLYHMKNKLLALNWKSNKTKIEAKDWLVETSGVEIPEGIQVVVFPPFTLLDVMNGYVRVNSLPLKIGAQDVSPFDKGAYTGEVSAEQIKEFSEYVLIGHSERRNNLKEDVEIISKKVGQALSQGLKVVVCFSNLDELSGLKTEGLIIAYEPVEAIGTGNPTDPAVVEEMAKKIKNMGFKDVLYGGSVNSKNIKTFLDLPSIDGALVGGESLDPKSFESLIKNAI